jgi:hypothetical protein
MSTTHDPIQSQLAAAGVLLSNAELLPATLETELRLYCERLAAAQAEQT